LRLSTFLVLFLAQAAIGQDSAALLRLQRSKAYLDINSAAPNARGFAGITTGSPGDTWHYPNTVSCVVVYDDGKYALEKRDEPTVGKPKVKVAEGSLSAGDLQQLKTILNDDALQKVASPSVADLPDNAVALREIESLDAQIERPDSTQHFTTLKRRVKTRDIGGMDVFLDNGTPLKKTLEPLMKWVDSLEKKSKSDLKDAKPQYCAPLNVG
jgi:hypothetical protein